MVSTSVIFGGIYIILYLYIIVLFLLYPGRTLLRHITQYIIPSIHNNTLQKKISRKDWGKTSDVNTGAQRRYKACMWSINFFFIYIRKKMLKFSLERATCDKKLSWPIHTFKTWIHWLLYKFIIIIFFCIKETHFFNIILRYLRNHFDFLIRDLYFGFFLFFENIDLTQKFHFFFFFSNSKGFWTNFDKLRLVYSLIILDHIIYIYINAICLRKGWLCDSIQ